MLFQQYQIQNVFDSFKKYIQNFKMYSFTGLFNHYVLRAFLYVLSTVCMDTFFILPLHHHST